MIASEIEALPAGDNLAVRTAMGGPVLEDIGECFFPQKGKETFKYFYPFNDIETISPRPMLVITGDQAHSIEFGQEAYERAAEPKELVLVPGAGHVDLYDRVELIPWDELNAFFEEYL